MNSHYKFLLAVVFNLLASSVMLAIDGCTDASACNYNLTATVDDGTCDYSCYDCVFPANDECLNALTIAPGVTVTGNLCCAHFDADMGPWAGFDSEYGVWYKVNIGDADMLSLNFWNGIMNGADAQDGTDVGIGLFIAEPDCSSLTALVGGVGFNGDPLDGFTFNTYEFGVALPLNADMYICLCTSDPYGCGDFILNVDLGTVGCTDWSSCSYNPLATMDDGSCIYEPGCQDPTACNYQPSYCPGGECIYSTNLSIQCFNDINQNGVMDWYETIASTGAITIPELNLEVLPDLDGYIWVENVAPGNYTLTYSDPEWLAVSNNLVISTSCETLYFGIYNPTVELMQQVSYPSPSTDIIGCLSSSSLGLWLENTGSLALNGLLTISFTDSLENNAAYNSPGFMDVGIDGMHVFEMEITDFYPAYSNLFHVNVLPPPVEYIGHTFNFEYHLVLYDTNEGIFYENTWNESRTVNCSYDPNQKTGSPGYSESNFILSGDEIEYLIEFQNTGSAAAQDVVIHDQIDLSVFDINSLQTTAGSHSFSTIIQDDGLVKFQFHNIMLPDSNSDEPGSHGFVSYRIRTLENLPFQTTLNNTAEIYFDNNPPVITNTFNHNIFDCDVLNENYNDLFSCEINDVYVQSGLLDFVENYDWYLDGEYYSSGPMLSINNAEVNVHSIELMVSNPLCSATSSFELTVYPAPQPSIELVGNNVVSSDGVTYQWYLNGELVVGESNAEFPVGNYTTGDYQVYAIATDVHGCSGTSNVLMASAISTNSVSSIELFPNPMEDYSTLKLPSGTWNVKCYNGTGQLVFAKQNVGNSMTIYRSEIPAGVYVMHVSNALGERSEIRFIAK